MCWDSAGITAATRSPAGTLLDEGLRWPRRASRWRTRPRSLVDKLVASGDIPPPGFGHRYHTIDPRATRLLQIAHELEVDHTYTQLLRAIEHALTQHASLAGRPLPINIDGAIAAVCGDMGLPPEVADALLIISRVPGLAAHALEEQRREKPDARHRPDVASLRWSFRTQSARPEEMRIANSLLVNGY